MPPAFAAIGGFFAQMAIGAGATFATATVVGTVAAAIVIGGGLYAVTAFAAAAMRPKDSNRAAAAHQVINMSSAPRVRIYGRMRVGGTRAYIGTDDAGSGHTDLSLIQAIMLASHEIDAIEEYFIGDQLLTTAPGVITDSPYPANALAILAYFGTSTQTASSALLSYATGWTSNHRLRGIAYIVALMNANFSVEYFQRVFPQSINTTFRCTVRGAKVYDPREVTHDVNDEATWEWSDNPGLCIMDYLTHSDGMGLPRSRIDVDSFEAFADLCDELVSLHPSGTEKRYCLGGEIRLSESPIDALPRMMAACDGEFYQTPEGKIAIRGGQWVAPTVTILNGQIEQIEQMAEGNDALAVFNELKVVYTSPSHDYQPTEADPWADAAAQAEHGRIVEDFVVDMVQSPSQARRLAKIYMHKQNPTLVGTIVTNLSALDALDQENATVKIDELSVDDTFQIKSFELRSDMKCALSISALSSAAYAWTPSTEQGTAPA